MHFTTINTAESFAMTVFSIRNDYTIGTLDVLQARDACTDMGMTYSAIVQCTDCVVFPSDIIFYHYDL